MFEFIEFIGSVESKIEVQTKKGTPIDNTQSPNPDAKTIMFFNDLVGKHPRWVLRKEACGLYNCAGHIWASRRTSIYDQKYYELIIAEDKYRTLVADEKPKHGDIALYKCGSSILHVGMVSEIRFIDSSDNLGIPWILSKLNDGYGEILHHYCDVPWKDNDYQVSFLTER
jgi:hypothetical protein